jgi:hypothetical protein
MKASSALSHACLAAVALACAACSPLEVEWTAGAEELGVAAHGPPDATLIVLAGLPSEPHTIPGEPSLWTTVGPDRAGQAPNVEVARVVFDAGGNARASIKVGPLPADVVLVQAVVLTPQTPIPRFVAVSGCMAVSRKDGRLTIRPHVVEVLLSPIWWRIGAVLALVALGVALRRIPASALGSRWIWLPALFLAAAFLLQARLRAPPDEALWLDAPPPFLPNSIDERRRNMDPLDRVTRSGFRELVNGVRDAMTEADAVAILPASAEWASRRDAWQAQWLLWPRKTEMLEPGTDPFARRGLYLTFDAGPARPGARVRFKNRAGCLWFLEAGEPK